MKKITTTAFNPSGGGGFYHSKGFEGILTPKDKKFLKIFRVEGNPLIQKPTQTNLFKGEGNKYIPFLKKKIFVWCKTKKAAFTLAEILITLAVIGIVAALTMPVLINKYQERVTITKVKKMYSTLNQAVKLAEVDNGPINMWDLPTPVNGGSQKLYSYLKPYLRVAKECVEDNSSNCIDENVTLTQLDGTTWTSASSYASSSYVRIFLSDGGLLWFRTTSRMNNGYCGDNDAGYTDVCGMFWYDVNGSASPNTMAKDIFVFVLRPTGIYPHDMNECYLDDHGWGCLKWILEHDNMNYPKTKPSE